MISIKSFVFDCSLLSSSVNFYEMRFTVTGPRINLFSNHIYSCRTLQVIMICEFRAKKKTTSEAIFNSIGSAPKDRRKFVAHISVTFSRDTSVYSVDRRECEHICNNSNNCNSLSLFAGHMRYRRKGQEKWSIKQPRSDGVRALYEIVFANVEFNVCFYGYCFVLWPQPEACQVACQRRTRENRIARSNVAL